ncbi:CRISPR-associated protein [bacterium BMS3Bbin12]|nr:CRISPR-associated protein [bacterium BMS3Bbin12]GBE50880.1 CRISPR-associated protein [bacterium BMS3Bbin13]
MAWAVAEVLDADEAEARLSSHPGAIHYPVANGGGRALSCPLPGSLNSLFDRYKKGQTRFKTRREAAPTKKDPSGRKVTGQTLSQPPKPRFRQVSYDNPPVRFLYELRDMTESAGFLPWPLMEAVRLVETVRNGAATRLKEELPGKADTIVRMFGLCRDTTEADKAGRIRIIPLPSIGHQHADHGIRRLLVEIPRDCPVAANDIAWAFSVTRGFNESTGEISWMLVSTEKGGMLNQYGIGNDNQVGFRCWRTVTPMALPVARPHGRKEGTERVDIERGAAAAVTQALRHVEITFKPASIRVQREPLDAKGVRAENFAIGTRFVSARLWHVEINFTQPIVGPLLAGDGRYLGLGLMRPVKRVEGALSFVVVDGLSLLASSQSVTRALRRAVMSLVQNRLGQQTKLPTFFSGHEADGSPARRGGRSHLAFAFDQARQRLLVIAPHLLGRRQPRKEECENLRLLDAALSDFRELRAGSAGLLRLEPSTIVEDDDPIFVCAKTWITQTDYFPTRYSKGATPEQAIIADVGLELRRRGFPIPAGIDKISVCRGPGGGLSAQLRLVFSTAIGGPLLLGKACNFGSGLFVGVR